MASLLNMSSSRLVGSKFLPYDAEIEYLRVDGATLPYINTDYTPVGRDLEIAITFNTTNNGPDYELFSTSSSDSNMGRYAVVRSGNSYTLLYFATKSHRRRPYSSGGRRHSIAISDEKYVLDGTEHAYDYSDYGTENNNPIVLFDKSVLRDVSIYSFSIKKAGSLVLDFIPVRVGNVGYMYDKVSGKLFGNAGTGAFILGADKTN